MSLSFGCPHCDDHFVGDSRPGECICQSAYRTGLYDGKAELRAENERLRAVLETLSDGACHNGYGGCDMRCKDIAYAALSEGDP